MVLKVLLILNIAVFICWQILPVEFMAENFLVSWTGVMSGRFWTLLTSVFSHNSFFHLFLNLFALQSFGSAVESYTGSRRLLQLYLLTGIAGSVLHCVVSDALLGYPELPALGASGAVCGIILFFSFSFPARKILFLAVIPVPAIWGSILLVGLDLWGLSSQAKGGGLPIGHGAHLGGALTGLLYYLSVKKKILLDARHSSDL